MTTAVGNRPADGAPSRTDGGESVMAFPQCLVCADDSGRGSGSSGPRAAQSIARASVGRNRQPVPEGRGRRGEGPGQSGLHHLGAPDNIREGMELSVVRKGEEFKHPLTGVVLVGLMTTWGVIISKVSETMHGTVRLAKATVNPRPGDGYVLRRENPIGLVPITGGFCPIRVSREELTERFRIALSKPGASR